MVSLWSVIVTYWISFSYTQLRNLWSFAKHASNTVKVVRIAECFGFQKQTNGGKVDVWHLSVWSDFVSREGLLRSDYLGRTKCFCWWRVTVISGSWEIDETHRALAHWSQPQHWQSMAWLVMHKNEVKWATCESVSPFLQCCWSCTAICRICIDKLGSKMIYNQHFQSLSVCMCITGSKFFFAKERKINK